MTEFKFLFHLATTKDDWNGFIFQIVSGQFENYSFVKPLRRVLIFSQPDVFNINFCLDGVKGRLGARLDELQTKEIVKFASRNIDMESRLDFFCVPVKCLNVQFGNGGEQ